MITTTREEFATAVRLHQAGQLAAATRLYESILDRDESDADAFHLLGVARHQQGQSELAARLIRRAIALRPEVAVFRATLGEAYRALGHFNEAAGCCRVALGLGLNDFAVHNNLGLASHALGLHAEAVEAFRAALALRPDDALAHTNLGTVLRAQDDSDAALSHLFRAVELDPTLAAARSNLGQLLLDFGRPEEALPHCQEAVLLEPNRAEAHNNLGNVHRALGRLFDAKTAYEQAIRLNPALAQAHVSLAKTLQQEGRWDEALSWLRRACELQPGSLVFLAHFAEAAVDRDRLDLAVACYQKMLKLDANLPATHNALGWLLQEEDQLDESRDHLHECLRLKPDFAIAHVNLGGIHEKLGDFAAAETSFRTASNYPEASAPALARLALLLRGSLPDADCEAAEQWLARSDRSDPARINLLYGMACVCDARKRYSEAAACSREANALSLAQFERRDLAYEPAEHERLISGLIAAFDYGFFARLSGAGIGIRQPVFVFGIPRSGTTLIEQILASHPAVQGAGELPLGLQAFQAIPELLNRSDPPVSCIADLSLEAVNQLAQCYVEELRKRHGLERTRIVDKMPNNYIYLGLLANLFPKATWIHCRRDPRDVAVSCWITGFRSVRWACNVRHIATRIEQHDRLMEHWRAVLPVSIHQIDYEETVADLERVARRLVAACGLDWHPACLDFHRTQRPVRTASFTQVRQPVYHSSIGRWKNYETELADLFELL